MSGSLRSTEQSVTINGAFLRRETLKAVRQFFKPITSAFEIQRPGGAAEHEAPAVDLKPPRAKVR